MVLWRKRKMTYPVDNLLEGRGIPISVTKHDTVDFALSLMIENDFSQLPVVDENNFPLGMITYESIVRGIINFKANIDKIPVSNVIVNAPIFSIEDDLFDLLNRLRDTNAVLISDFTGELVGIVTSYDSTEYFRKRAEDLMYIEDIESIIKDLILSYFTHNENFPIEQDAIDFEGINSAIEMVTITLDDIRRRFSAALSLYINKSTISTNKQEINPEIFEESFMKLQNDPKPKGFEELTLSEYIAILLDKSRWDYYQPIFELSLDNVKNLLDDIRKSRNILAHFLGELSPHQRDQLKFCADWLNRKQTDFEDNKTKELIDRISNKEKRSEEEIGPNIIQVSEDFDQNTSKYAPLASWLQSQPGRIDRVRLTFEDVEQIIDAELPQSAYQHRNWWANDSVGHVQSKQWLDAGWRVGYRNMTAKEVTFVRIKERERAYIDFFSPIIAELREKTKMPIKDSSPDGVSWIELIKLPKIGPQKAIIAYSFALNNRFRIELYIDTGEEDSNKAIFDSLKSDYIEIEREMVQSLSWERLDSKRASRIALYHEGSITDSNDKLNDLKNWAFTWLQQFFNVFFDRANHAIKENTTT